MKLQETAGLLQNVEVSRFEVLAGCLEALGVLAERTRLGPGSVVRPARRCRRAARPGRGGAGRGLRRPDKARGRSCEPGLGAEFAGLGAFRKAFRRPCMGMEAGYKQDIAELLPERGK